MTNLSDDQKAQICADAFNPLNDAMEKLIEDRAAVASATGPTRALLEADTALEDALIAMGAATTVYDHSIAESGAISALSNYINVSRQRMMSAMAAKAMTKDGGL